MRIEYDFTDSVRNPYAKHFKKQVTMRLGTDVIEYFKALSEETGMPYLFFPANLLPCDLIGQDFGSGASRMDL